MLARGVRWSTKAQLLMLGGHACTLATLEIHGAITGNLETAGPGMPLPGRLQVVCRPGRRATLREGGMRWGRGQGHIFGPQLEAEVIYLRAEAPLHSLRRLKI